MTPFIFFIDLTIRICSCFIPKSEKRKVFRAKWYITITSPIIKRRYKGLLVKLRKKVKSEKITVAFLVGEPQKWNCQSLYDLLEAHPNFEPIVLLAPVTQVTNGTLSFLSTINDLECFFQNLGIRYIKAYDESTSTYTSINSLDIDIVFYPQPWGLHKPTQGFINTSKNSLSCYAPYCFHMFNSKTNYTRNFHALLWTYYVECKEYLERYREAFNATNCIAVGNIKLDNYTNHPNAPETSSVNKKIHIIYAPHHSFSGQYMMATFADNGKFILDLAKSHPEFHWTFKPHPRLKDEIILNNVMSIEEVENYYEDWSKIGTVHNSGNYYPLFESSNLMITDCISFLAEYLPSGNPLILLKSSRPKAASFSALGMKIIEHYYQVENNDELRTAFYSLLVEHKDPLKEARWSSIKHLGFESNRKVAKKILQHLEGQLGI